LHWRGSLEIKMRIINGVEHFTTGDVSALVGKSRLTITNWDKYSDMLEKGQGDRLIPKPLKVNGIRYWTEEQVERIKEFSETMERGTMSYFNREKMWGQRGKKIQDRLKVKREEQRKSLLKMKELSLAEQEKRRWESRLKALKNGLIEEDD